jgi:hypothetical protein
MRKKPNKKQTSQMMNQKTMTSTATTNNNTPCTMTTSPDTLISIIQQRHSRIKSASARADIGLFDFGDCYVCYDDDADKVNTWLAGTGLCKHVELSPQVWEFSLCECSIPLANMDKAVDIILGHASVALVGHINERNIPKYIMIKFLKRTGVAVVNTKDMTLDGLRPFENGEPINEKADPLADVF